MVRAHSGECGPITDLVRAPQSTEVGPRSDAARQLLGDLFSGATRRVVVIGDRSDVRSEPNLHGEDGLQAGAWNPGARSVLQLDPAGGEGNEFGEGASVQGFSEAERQAAYRTFLGVRRAIVEMTESTDPVGFVSKLREAAAHLGPVVAAALDQKVQSFLALPEPTRGIAALNPPAPPLDTWVCGDCGDEGTGWHDCPVLANREIVDDSTP